jgi:hypothetical protein
MVYPPMVYLTLFIIMKFSVLSIQNTEARKMVRVSGTVRISGEFEILHAKLVINLIYLKILFFIHTFGLKLIFHAVYACISILLSMHSKIFISSWSHNSL